MGLSKIWRVYENLLPLLCFSPFLKGLIRWLGLGCCEPLSDPFVHITALKDQQKERESRVKVKRQNKKVELLLNAASPWQLCNLLASEQQRPRVSRCATRVIQESRIATRRCVCVCTQQMLESSVNQQTQEEPKQPAATWSWKKKKTLPSGPSVQNPPRWPKTKACRSRFMHVSFM